MLNKAWENDPPVQWFAAAYVNYKRPVQTSGSAWKKALDNTKAMFHRIVHSGDKS